jgi:hypothetical protein
VATILVQVSSARATVAETIAATSKLRQTLLFILDLPEGNASSLFHLDLIDLSPSGQTELFWRGSCPCRAAESGMNRT